MIGKEAFEELVELAHDQLGVANMTGQIQLADRYGYPISEDKEREICRIILNTPEIKHILDNS